MKKSVTLHIKPEKIFDLTAENQAGKRIEQKPEPEGREGETGNEPPCRGKAVTSPHVKHSGREGQRERTDGRGRQGDREKKHFGHAEISK